MSARERIDVPEAAELIAARMGRFGSRRVAVDNATGCILRQEVHAERDQPPFDRVTMDGIALRRAAAGQDHRSFRIAGTQGAGVPAVRLEREDECIEIMTGAMLPNGADTIVPVERIQAGDGFATLEDGYEPTPGQFIHRRGSDHSAGTRLLGSGLRIGPAEMAALTIGGVSEIDVAAWPAIAVVSTGDELVDLGQPISPFQIRSTNGRVIGAALTSCGAERVTQAHLPDDPAQLLDAIGKLHREHDVLILSGGVSMGKYDYVPDILARLDVKLVFHRIRQRPGLPMWFGISADGKPVFALPGNPVSTLVCLRRYVLPALYEALGTPRETALGIPLAEGFDFEPDLTCFLPVVLAASSDGTMVAVPRPTNTSGDFVSLAGTDGFVELRRGMNHFSAGYDAPFFSWSAVRCT